MQIHELLQFVDEAVYLKTGKYLNDLQRRVLEGTLKHQKYSDIAEDYGCSTGHAKDVGYEILQILSEIFDEPIDKGNLKSVLQRQGNVNIAVVNNNYSENSSTNLSLKQTQTEINSSHMSNAKFQQYKKTQIKKINKLREFGLDDEQISEVLELPLAIVKQVEVEE